MIRRSCRFYVAEKGADGHACDRSAGAAVAVWTSLSRHLQEPARASGEGFGVVIAGGSLYLRE
jgi:hypothetical protein